MNGPCGSCSQPSQDGSRWCRACDPTRRIMREIAERQANPLNTACVRCRGLIYPNSHHVCPVVMREQAKEAKPWA